MFQYEGNGFKPTFFLRTLKKPTHLRMRPTCQVCFKDKPSHACTACGLFVHSDCRRWQYMDDGKPENRYLCANCLSAD